MTLLRTELAQARARNAELVTSSVELESISKGGHAATDKAVTVAGATLRQLHVASYHGDQALGASSSRQVTPMWELGVAAPSTATGVFNTGDDSCSSPRRRSPAATPDGHTALPNARRSPSPKEGLVAPVLPRMGSTVAVPPTVASPAYADMGAILQEAIVQRIACHNVQYRRQQQQFQHMSSTVEDSIRASRSKQTP